MSDTESNYLTNKNSLSNWAIWWNDWWINYGTNGWTYVGLVMQVTTIFQIPNYVGGFWIWYGNICWWKITFLDIKISCEWRFNKIKPFKPTTYPKNND